MRILEQMPVPKSGNYGRAFHQRVNVWREDEKMQELPLHPNLTAIATKIAGTPTSTIARPHSGQDARITSTHRLSPRSSQMTARSRHYQPGSLCKILQWRWVACLFCLNLTICWRWRISLPRIKRGAARAARHRMVSQNHHSSPDGRLHVSPWNDFSYSRAQSERPMASSTRSDLYRGSSYLQWSSAYCYRSP